MISVLFKKKKKKMFNKELKYTTNTIIDASKSFHYNEYVTVGKTTKNVKDSIR